MSREGASLYHSNIFFKEVKQKKLPQGYTLSVISQYNIIISHSPKRGDETSAGPSDKEGNVSKLRARIMGQRGLLGNIHDFHSTV